MTSESAMGEVTTLAKNLPTFASLRTTIPMNIVECNLKPGSPDRLVLGSSEWRNGCSC